MRLILLTTGTFLPGYYNKIIIGYFILELLIFSGVARIFSGWGQGAWLFSVEGSNGAWFFRIGGFNLFWKGVVGPPSSII